jgi:hypothetical protein
VKVCGVPPGGESPANAGNRISHNQARIHGIVHHFVNPLRHTLYGFQLTACATRFKCSNNLLRREFINAYLPNVGKHIPV